MLCLLVLCFFFLILLWKIFNLRYSVIEPPEVSRKLPLVGHGHLFLGGSVGVWNGIQSISDECLEKGGITRFYLGLHNGYGKDYDIHQAVMFALLCSSSKGVTKLLICTAITDPEICLEVCNAFLQKAYIYSFGKPFLGDGLILGSVPTWMKHRKLLSPAFNQQVLNSFMGVFNQQARRLMDQFASEVGKPFDQERFLRLNNLETICITAFGVGIDEYESIQKQYIPCMSEVLIIFTERFQKFWLHSDFIYNLTSLKKRQDKVLEKLLNLSNSIIHQKKQEMKMKILSGSHDSEKSQQGKLKPFMDLILELANETNCFTDQEIREETDNIIAGGHDTSATTLTFAFLLLGTHPEIQQKVYDEVIRIGRSGDIDLDKDDVTKLTYIDAVLKETLRLYPAVPVIARYIDKDFKIENYTLKANSSCFFFLNGLGKHAMWGPDANEFKPERWLDQSSLPDPKYYAAFGLGRRSCIGRVYGMMSMKTIMVHMLRRYRIKSDITNLKLKLDVMLRPESGHHITLELRN